LKKVLQPYMFAHTLSREEIEKSRTKGGGSNFAPEKDTTLKEEKIKSSAPKQASQTDHKAEKSSTTKPMASTSTSTKQSVATPMSGYQEHKQKYQNVENKKVKTKVKKKSSGVVRAIRNSLGRHTPKEFPDIERYNFDVAVFTGTTEMALAAFLRAGQVNVDEWKDSALEDLLQEVVDGKADVGLDRNGRALRVISLAKVQVFDEKDESLLFKGYQSVRLPSDATLIRWNEDINPNESVEVIDSYNVRLSQGGFARPSFMNPRPALNINQSRKNYANIPDTIALEKSFSYLSESPQQAAASLLESVFNIFDAKATMFDKVAHLEIKKSKSKVYKGLNSEFHVHRCLLKKEYVSRIQRVIPGGAITPLVVNASSTTMTTEWFLWLHTNPATDKSIRDEVQKLVHENTTLKKLAKNVDLVDEALKDIVEDITALSLWGLNF